MEEQILTVELVIRSGDTNVVNVMLEGLALDRAAEILRRFLVVMGETL